MIEIDISRGAVDGNTYTIDANVTGYPYDVLVWSNDIRLVGICNRDPIVVQRRTINREAVAPFLVDHLIYRSDDGVTLIINGFRGTQRYSL